MLINQKANQCTLNAGKLHTTCLPRNSADQITNRLDMSLVVYHGRKATKQTNKQINCGICMIPVLFICLICRVVSEKMFENGGRMTENA